MKLEELVGVWKYEEIFEEGNSSGYLTLDIKSSGLYGKLSATEFHNDNSDPVNFIEEFDVRQIEGKVKFQGFSFESNDLIDEDFYLDHWISDLISHNLIVALSNDGQGIPGVVTLHKIK